MRKLFYLTVFAAAITLSSCGVKSVPIKGNYQDKPFEVTIEKTKDQVWDNVIDFFAQNGISIKTLDRQSGLIVSDKTNFKNTHTTENSSGQLQNPKAYVVVEKREYMGMPYIPNWLNL